MSMKNPHSKYGQIIADFIIIRCNIFPKIPLLKTEIELLLLSVQISKIFLIQPGMTRPTVLIILNIHILLSPTDGRHWLADYKMPFHSSDFYINLISLSFMKTSSPNLPEGNFGLILKIRR